MQVCHIFVYMYQVRTNVMSDFRIYIINKKTNLSLQKYLIINIISIASEKLIPSIKKAYRCHVKFFWF